MSIPRIIAVSTFALCLAQPALAQKKERKGKPVEASAVISKHDKDKDGKLSKDEVKGTRFAKVFEQLDTDKDGFLTAAEIQAGKKGREKKEKQKKTGK